MTTLIPLGNLTNQTAAQQVADAQAAAAAAEAKAEEMVTAQDGAVNTILSDDDSESVATLNTRFAAYLATATIGVGHI